MELSPTGRSAVPVGEHAAIVDWMSRPSDGSAPSPRCGRFSDRFHSQNTVDIERIRLGLDVRTTVSRILALELLLLHSN